MRQITEETLKSLGFRKNSNIYKELLHSNTTRFVYRFKGNRMSRATDRINDIQKVLNHLEIDFEVFNESPRGGKLGIKYIYK